VVYLIGFFPSAIHFAAGQCGGIAKQ
jgi:hypothetical protein